MILVMGAAMLTQSVAASVAGAALLIVVSVVMAAFSRAHAWLRVHMLDLWAMALVLIVMLPRGASAGHHSLAVPALAAFIVVFVGWSALRVMLARHERLGQQRGLRPGALVSAATTAAGLSAMALLCG